MSGPLWVPDLFDPGRPDPVTEAERAAHLAAHPDPRSYESRAAWLAAHPDEQAPVHRAGSVLGALYRALAPEADGTGPETEAS